MVGARVAVGFLTVLPAGRLDGLGDAWLSRAAVWFPVIGALVGAAAGGAVALADAAGLSLAVSGALGLVVAILLTRGLHEDGLADTADGLGVHGTRERRLAAMKDSAVGAHGALAMACALLIAALALAGLDAEHAARALVAAHVLSRTAMVLTAAALPSARAEGGLGRGLEVTPPAALIASVIAVAGVLVVAGVGDGAVALAVGVIVALLVGVVQLRVFGGRTGDTLGAAGKLVEVAVLVALSGAWAA